MWRDILSTGAKIATCTLPFLCAICRGHWDLARVVEFGRVLCVGFCQMGGLKMRFLLLSQLPIVLDFLLVHLGNHPGVFYVSLHCPTPDVGACGWRGVGGREGGKMGTKFCQHQSFRGN